MGSADRSGSGATLPTGKDSAGLDWTEKVALTKSSASAQRLHFNAIYEHNEKPQPEERGSRWRLIGGYSTEISPDTVLVAGVRRELQKEAIASIGIGAGHGEGAPGWRLMAGLQRSF
jgi:hypothetical protein